jgi:hypothetical protein
MRKDAFDMGQLVATPGALELFAAQGRRLAEFVVRHAAGDWGELARGGSLAVTGSGTRSFG